MRRTLLLLVCVLAAGLSSSAQDQPAVVPPRPPQKHQVVTAAQANGVYRYFKSEFRILALGHNKLKVQFDGVYMTLANSPNIGYASGEATIDGNIATFKPADTEHCEITLIFLPKKLKAVQDGSDADCGFGHNVNATGTYRKIKSGKPRFDSSP